MAGGNVELSVSLSLAQLIKDAQKASDVIKQQIKEPQVKVNVKVESNSLVKLSQTLNGTVGSAQQFSNALGLTATQAQSAIARITQLNNAGATTAEKYRILKNEFGLTATQMYQLGNAAKLVDGNLKAQAATIQNNSKNVASLANALGTSYGSAQRFAQGLGLTAKEASAVVSKLNELNSVGATNAQKFAVLNKELGITKTQFEQISKTTTQTSEGLTAVAAGAGAIAAGIGGVFVKGTQEFLAFDNAIRQSGVIGGSLGTPQFEALRKEVERLGITTTKAPAQIAEMSVSLSRAGFTAEETKVALEGIVTASEATGEDLQVVGDIIAKTVRTYALAAEESGNVADLLVQTANATNTSVNGLGESLTYVGSVAKASNQPLDDTLIALGLLGDAGLQGSMAGTNLAAALERLKVASAGADTEFSSLVRGSAKATEAFNIIGASARNTDGSMKSVIEILPQLQANLGKLGQADQDIVTKALFGVEGGRAVTTLLNATPDRIAAVTDQIKNAEGAALKASQALTQGLGGSLKLFTSSLSSAASAVGEFVAVGLEPAVKAATGFINLFLDLPAPIQAVLIATTALTGAYTAAIAVIATYKLLNIQLIATQATQALAMAAATLATKGAQAAQLLFNTQLSITKLNLIATNAALAVGKVATAVFATATGGATLSVGAFGVALATAAISLVAIAVLIKGIQFAAFALELAAANDAIAASAIAVDLTADAAFAAANKTSAAVDKLNQARKDGRALTDQEIKDAEGLLAANELRIKGIKEQIKEQEALKVAQEASFGGIGTEEQQAQVKAKEALIQTLKTSAKALEGENAQLQESIVLNKADADARGGNKESLENQLSALEKGNKEKQTAITQSLADGKITEDQARADNLAAEQEYLNDRIQLNESKLAELQKIKAESTKAEEIQKAGEDILKIEESIGNDRLKAAQNNVEERKRVQEEATEALTTAETEAQVKIASALSAGSITDDQANAQRLKAAQTRIEGEIALEQNGANEKQKIAQLQLALVENLASQREAVEKAALDRIEAANRESEARISESQQARILAVKQAQLDGTKSAEEVASAIAEIEQSGISETLALKRDELSQVQSLRDQGLLSAEEARTRELALNEELGTLNLQRIDKEIAAQEAASAAALKAVEDQKQAVLEAIDAAGDAAKGGLQSEDIQLGITADSKSQESSLLSAQLELQQALAQVEQTRFDSAIRKAELSGNEVKADQLKLAQLKAQQKATEKQFEIEKLQLRLAQEQRKIELERQRIAADIAVIEADIALKKAIANGASKEEIDNLQTILGLRQKQVEQVKEGGAQQQKLDEIEQATLKAKQENQQRQASDKEESPGQKFINSPIDNADDTKAVAKPDDSNKSAAKDSEKTPSRVTTSRGIQELSAEEREKQRIAEGRLNGFNAAGATLESTAQQLKTKPVNTTIQQLNTPVPAIATAKIQPIADIAGLGSALQTGNVQVVTKLDELKAAIMQLANTPRCLTVSAPDPVGAVGQVLADVGRASFRRAKL